MSRDAVSVVAGSDVEGANAEDLVSVIIPIYNNARFLAEAVDSVVGQSHGRWELLLINDGSTDASAAIAQRYAERYPGQVRCLEHPGGENRGTAATRNLGIRQARGRYLAFLDADDVWLPDKLRTQVAVLRAHPEVAMTYGPSRWWYGWTGDAEDIARDVVQDLGVPTGVVVPLPALLMRFLKNGKTVPIPASIMVRRDVVQRLGGFEESFRGFPNGLYEDQTFFAKLTLSESSLPTADVHCWYRQHPDAVTALVKRGRGHAAARFAFLTWLDGYLSAHGAAGSEVSTFVHQELWRRRHPRIARYLARARRIGARLHERAVSLVNLLLPL